MRVAVTSPRTSSVTRLIAEACVKANVDPVWMVDVDDDKIVQWLAANKIDFLITDRPIADKVVAQLAIEVVFIDDFQVRDLNMKCGAPTVCMDNTGCIDRLADYIRNGTNFNTQTKLEELRHELRKAEAEVNRICDLIVAVHRIKARRST